MAFSFLQKIKDILTQKSCMSEKGMKDEEKVIWIIAGLGNPKAELLDSRHNIGWRVIDALAEELGIKVEEEAFFGLTGRGEIAGQSVLLVKPLTYMNRSGECVKAVCDYYGVEADHTLVIFDDISLEPGNLRIRKKGSAGGHNGVKSLIACLDSEDFPRIKVGVGAPNGDLIEHVLGSFQGEEAELMRETAKRAAKAAQAIISEGIDPAMNVYNQKNHN